VASGLVALVLGAFGGHHSGTPVVVIGVGAWLFFGGAYLLAFWSLSGQTPGMRFLGLHIEAGGNRRLGLRRSFRRLVGLVLAALPLLLGFLGVFTDERRCGWQDRLAQTEVVYEPVSPAGPTVP